MSLVGSVLSGRYEILEEIGEGGMATVYKAKCKLLNRYVAVKVLRGEFAKDSQFVKRFRAEAQSAASLAHPNIVSVYDVGEENGINYIVMECLEGKTLKDYIEENGKLSNLVTLKFASQIASALEAAHKAKIIHRDIKPQNIVFSNNENVLKVTDFGIAKMISTNTITSQSATMGSVHYFSPEHAKGCYIDEKSDIYSLGIVMYEMATGKLPFDADTAVSVALKQIQEEPKAPREVEPTVSEDLNAIILKAIQKNSLNRYKSATEMLDDIFAAINNPGHIFKPETKVLAGGTQVIPIIGLKDADKPSIGDVEENVIELSRKHNRVYIEDKNNHMDDKVQEEVSKYKKDLGENSKKKKLIIIIVSIVATICVGVIAFMTVKLIGNFNREKEETKIQIDVVPKLVGEDFEEARKAYAKKGYTIELDKYEYSSEVEEGNIISQSIKAGEKITSDKITVVVSKGQKLVTMIDTVGKDYTVAKYELESLGLVPEFEFEENDKIEKNIIIEQDVKAKEEIAVGSTVVIKVSEGNGKATIIVPDVVGDNGEEAKKTLELLSLDVSINYTEDTTKSNGVVLKQSAVENTELEEGSKITLTVNRLQKSKTVTLDLTGMIPTESTGTEGTGEVEGEVQEPAPPPSVTLKVTATVEGVTNTIVQDRKITAEDKVEVTVNGFTTATLKIYIDGEYKGEQKVTFD